MKLKGKKPVDARSPESCEGLQKMAGVSLAVAEAHWPLGPLCALGAVLNEKYPRNGFKQDLHESEGY